MPESEGGYSVEIFEFPGCVSQGETLGDALANLEQAAANWIDAMIKVGNSIPSPEAENTYNGKVLLRLPRSIHSRAVRMAQRDGVSLNSFLLTAIAVRVGAKATRALIDGDG